MKEKIGYFVKSGEVSPSQVKDNVKEPNIMRVYLAGPDVFLPNAVEIGKAKKRICTQYSFEGVYPLDAPFDVLVDLDSPVDMGHTTFDLMVELMDSCDLVIANLTPFRGPSMDVGTAVEIGYMYGCGKPVFGYTNVVKDYAERVEPDDFFVESFGLVDNVMVEGPVYRTGVVVVRADVPSNEIYTSLEGFTACVRQAAEKLLSQQP